MMERGVLVVELHGGRRRGAGIIFKGGRGMAGRPAEVDSLISGAGRMGWGIDYYSLAGLAMEESRKETDVGAGGDDAEWMDGRCGCVCVCLPGMDEWMPFGYGRIPCPRPRASVGSAAELSPPTSPPPTIESPPLAPIIPLAPAGFFSFPEEQKLVFGWNC